MFPTPAYNKTTKAIKTKGEVVVQGTHLDLSVKCGSTPTHLRGKRNGVGYSVQFPFRIACNQNIIQKLCLVRDNIKSPAVNECCYLGREGASQTMCPLKYSKDVLQPLSSPVNG